jgi:type II secretion system protein H
MTARKAPKMTLTARNCSPRSGFTLLEIVIVLVIASLVMAGAVGLMTYSSDEQALRKATGEIEMLAKRARTTAILQQTPYALEFRQGVVRMMPLAQSGRSEKKPLGGRRRAAEPVVDEGGGNRWELSLDNGMQMMIQRWNSEAWLPTAKDAIHVWRFDPNGLCEPISIRLNIDKSWMSAAFHPLTARLRDSQFETR